MTPFNTAIVNWIRQSFDFGGRATRSDYWWTRLLVLLVYAVLMTLFIMGGAEEWLVNFADLQMTIEREGAGSDRTGLPEPADLPPLSSLSMFAFVFGIVFGLLTFFADISLSFRRFHDLGQPGWLHFVFLALGAFLPGVQFGQLIWFAFPGQPRSNRFGPNPLANDTAIFD